MKKVISCIEKTLERGELFYLFGDGDLDEISSVLIMEKALKRLGAEVYPPFFSDRSRYGYGLSPHYLGVFEKKKPGLILVLDCGTGNRKEIEKVKRMGFSVAVVDHHRPTGPLPRAAMLNPKTKKDSPWYNLCTGALSSRLAEALLGSRAAKKDKEFFEIMACFATITDQMVRDEANQEIIDKGLGAFSGTSHPALSVLFEESGAGSRIRASEVERYVTPLLSAAEHRTVYLFLKERDREKAREVVGLLKKKRELQKERVEEIIREVKDGLETKEKIIFAGDRDWPLFLAARAASNLVSEYKVPVFLYEKGERESQGSARSGSDYDLLELMKPCARLLINWGGHKQAAGFGLKNKNLPRFKKCLIKNL